ncbi:asparagine synthase-related protein, partial [Salmonella enterica subsp. enterica serovar Montevideo]|nr:asparagine synthase-related protein [Salmonella enterica subsp. enterica serovar Montevideo]
HMYDCARANKAMSAWGVEARVPFLDKKFLDVAMRINPQDKMCDNRARRMRAEGFTRPEETTQLLKCLNIPRLAFATLQRAQNFHA